MKKATNKDVTATLAALKKLSSKRVLKGMSRYGLPQQNALGVSVSNIQKLAKKIGRDHELALGLWETGVYEARMLTAFVDEPARVTSAQMDRWCRDFDNWGIVDTLCFKLWDQVPHAWTKVRKWSTSRGEFQKRAAFALLGCLALHDEDAPDEKFLKMLPLIEAGACDERNFVKKGVSWALRSIGRRSLPLNAACVKLAGTLAESLDAGPRWVGKDAFKELSSPHLQRALIRRA
jgi:3-methyladenine DNA glycosylase AlkD